MKKIFLAIITILLPVIASSTAIAQSEDDVVINEFLTYRVSAKAFEYVELLVTAPGADLRGWTISDVDSRGENKCSLDGDVRLPADATYLQNVPRGTYVVVELMAPFSGPSPLTEDTSLADATPRSLVLKLTTRGVHTDGFAILTSSDNLQLYAGSRSSGTLIDQVLWGGSHSLVAGASWGDNNECTIADNINHGACVPDGSDVRFVPSNQSSPDGFKANDTGSSFVIDERSNGTPGTVNSGVDDHEGTLPIQLAVFSASVTDANHITLQWSTVSEINNYGFYVERRPEGSNDFTTVSGLISGAGTSLEMHSYEWVDADVPAGSYEYRLHQVDLDGSSTYSYVITVTSDAVLGVRDGTHPLVFGLEQNYPNPFNPSTRVAFVLGDQSYVRLVVFDALGREVATLASEILPPGEHSRVWDATNLPSGTYICRLDAASLNNAATSFTQVRKMVLAR